jgi:transcriptional regulator with XRE-family HTH domain
MLDTPQLSRYTQAMSKPKVSAENATGFAQRLRELRRRKNLTQIELAELTGVSSVHIGRLEKGSSQPTAEIIKRLGEGLGASSGYLLDGTEENAVTAYLEDAELAEQFQLISRLPSEDKAVIKVLVDAFLFKRQVEKSLADSSFAPHKIASKPKAS